MIDRKHPLPLVQQCQILELSRSSVYYVPQPVSAADLALMRQIDELHLQYPFAGSRMLRDILQLNGVAVGRKHVATLMRRMGIEALYQRYWWFVLAGLGVLYAQVERRHTEMVHP